MTNTLVSVDVIAGELHPTAGPTHPVVGKGFRTGELLIVITPETARQWIAALGTITNEKEDN